MIAIVVGVSLIPTIQNAVNMTTNTTTSTPAPYILPDTASNDMNMTIGAIVGVVVVYIVLIVLKKKGIIGNKSTLKDRVKEVEDDIKDSSQSKT